MRGGVREGEEEGGRERERERESERERENVCECGYVREREALESRWRK